MNSAKSLHHETNEIFHMTSVRYSSSFDPFCQIVEDDVTPNLEDEPNSYFAHSNTSVEEISPKEIARQEQYSPDDSTGIDVNLDAFNTPYSQVINSLSHEVDCDNAVLKEISSDDLKGFNSEQQMNEIERPKRKYLRQATLSGNNPFRCTSPLSDSLSITSEPIEAVDLDMEQISCSLEDQSFDPLQTIYSDEGSGDEKSHRFEISSSGANTPSSCASCKSYSTSDISREGICESDAIDKQETDPVGKLQRKVIHCVLEDCYYAHLDTCGKTINTENQTLLMILELCSHLSSQCNEIISIGLNDLNRYGREVVNREDIIPMTFIQEDWLHIRDPMFHPDVDITAYWENHLIRFPLENFSKYLQDENSDPCELMRFHVSGSENKIPPLTSTCRFEWVNNDHGLVLQIECRITRYINPSTNYSPQKCRNQNTLNRRIYCYDFEVLIPLPNVVRPIKEDKTISTTSPLGECSYILYLHTSKGNATYETEVNNIIWRIDHLSLNHKTVFKPHSLKCEIKCLRDSLSMDLIHSANLQRDQMHLSYRVNTTLLSSSVIRSISIESVNVSTIDEDDEHTDTDMESSYLFQRIVNYTTRFQYIVDIAVSES